MIPFRRFFPLLLAVASVMAFAGIANAQTWREIGTLPDSLDLRCAYFWDTAHGVVGGANCIYVYTSGVWTPAQYPEAPDTIKSLRLLDGVHLFAACGTTCVWESADRGKTWQKTTAAITKADDIYFGSDGQIHGVNLKGSGGLMPGTTFAHLRPFTDVVARDDQNLNAYSTDGGLTWNNQLPPSIDCGYNVIVDSCTGTFYTLTDGIKGELWASINGGKNWNMIYDFAGQAHDIIEGAIDNVLYVQGISGVWVSLGGVVWHLINGPGSQLEDRRMFEFGPNGRYLVDMVKGAVWLFDGGANLWFPNPIVGIGLYKNSECAPSDFTLNMFMPTYADSLHVSVSANDGIIVSPADTAFAFLPGTAIQHYTIQVPPGEESGTIYFHDSIGSVTTCYPRLAWDTAISFNLLPKHVHVSLPSTVKVPYCQDALIPITVTTDPCDTLRIDSVMVEATNGTFVFSGTLPVIVMPGDTDTLWLLGTHLHPGSFTLDEVELTGTTYSGNGSFDTILTLTGTISGVGAPSKIYFSSASKLTSCVGTRFPLVLHTYYCDSISIDSLIIDDTSGAYIIGASTPAIVHANSDDTIWISADESVPGTYSTNLHLYGHSAMLGPIDTSFHIFFNVLPTPAHPRAIAHNVTLSNCKLSTVSFLLQSLPCDSVEFTYCTISVSGTGISMSNDLSLPLSLPSATSDTVHLSFPVQGLTGTYIITAHLKGKYLGSTVTFDTTVAFTMTCTSEKSALAPNLASVDFGSISICGSADTTVTFTNYGCDSITVTGDATAWPAGWSATDTTFPLTLAPDSSFSVTIHFIPTPNSNSVPTLDYPFEYYGGSSSGSLTLTATIVPAIASMSVSDTFFDLGSMARCTLHSSDTFVTFTNTGCDSLALSGAALAGTGFTLMNGSDTLLGPNQSATCRIHFFDSVPNTYPGTFRITGTGSHGGNRIDTTVMLLALIVPGNHAASLDRNAIDFGTTTICEERDSTVTITNTGCEPDTIDAASFSSTQFSFESSISFPLVLQPDSSIAFRVATEIDTAGHPNNNSGTLQISMSDSLQLPAISLVRGITYPGTFALGLTAQPSAPLHSIAPVTVERTAGIIPNEAEEVDFDLVYNEDLLGYADPIQTDVTYLSKVLLANGMTDRTFAMKPASDRDTIATFPFQTYLTKNTSTSITLTRPQFVASGKISPECVASIDSTGTPSNFTLQLSCGDSTILASWSSSPPFFISGIVPNPASTSLRVQGVGDIVSVELDDVLGRPAILSSQYSFPFTLDVSTMPPGTYYVRLSEDGYVQTRRIEIAR